MWLGRRFDDGEDLIGGEEREKEVEKKRGGGMGGLNCIAMAVLGFCNR